MPRHGEIESRSRRHRRAVRQKEDRLWRLASLRCSQPLAKEVKRKLALLSPVFAAPDIFVHCGGRGLSGRLLCERKPGGRNSRQTGGEHWGSLGQERTTGHSPFKIRNQI